MIARQALDAMVYALVVTTIALALGGVIRISGGTAADVVLFTFVSGIVVLGYATYSLLPGRPWRIEHTDSGMELIRRNRTRTVGTREVTRFQAVVQSLPPLRWYTIPPDERLSPAAKLFVAGVCILLMSIGIEAAFIW
ncbi:DUF7555 family protein [Halorubrum miltondacostae]|uniref:DUF7555 family protein n=1 Tax=Halorubrum miltondacostae TaxID=3076378 RepID=UPI00352734A6